MTEQKGKDQGIYIGEFVNGMMHGQGGIMKFDGKPMEYGIWKYGNFVENRYAEYKLYKAVNKKPTNVSPDIQKYWAYQKPLDMLNLTSDNMGWRDETKLNLIKL